MDGLTLDFIEGVNGKELGNSFGKRIAAGWDITGGKEIHLDASLPGSGKQPTSKVDTNESDYNRRLCSFDRFRSSSAGEALRLSLSSVTISNSGIRKKAILMAKPEGSNSLIEIHIEAESAGDCLPINDRADLSLDRPHSPQNIKEGLYHPAFISAGGPLNDALKNPFQ